MPLTFDQITAITNELYLPKFPQLFADMNLLQKRCHAKGSKPQGGEQIKQHVFYQQNKGGFYSEYDTFDISAEEQITAAFWSWRFLEIPITLSRSDVLRNAGPPAVKSLMDAKMKGAAIRASQLLAQGFFGTGNDSTVAINSIDNMVDDGTTLQASATFGGISKTDNSWWAGNTHTGAGAATSYALMSIAEAKVVDGNIRPTIWEMHPETFSAYMRENQPDQRYMKQDEMDAGFRTASFNGRTVVADRYVPDGADAANRIYGLNEDFIDLVTHSDENMRLEPFAKPVDQAVIVGHIMWAGNLTSSDPSRHVAIHNFENTT